MELALPAYLGGLAPFIVGIFVVALLVGAVAYGMRKRDQEPPPPSQPQRRMGAWTTPEERDRPRTPEHGPGHDDDEDAVGYVRGHRESDRLQTEADGERVLPHEIRNPGSHPEEPSEEDKKWRPGGSGSFGSGGAGAR
ncbi:DUF6479 family protein [Streptoverticillium reticulum]|uniref:DUF6479 family protein n=1 Tax=Streptoverticillium reticulum TaxID=1433415 RepID=UPI0039BF95B3